ncbi:hypothetical protein GCM10023194_33040 [Planotetraspora phitsanulokensis]|uniref:Uncharacterized protein n=1 Tax=Planotetraspora phitsanulokensis TaxID=575192 RepID=A0A8J3U128_9ACTN|nr:hypothetical protein Pph01_15710 [Planotetraspora phitsanulokensis]
MPIQNDSGDAACVPSTRPTASPEDAAPFTDVRIGAPSITTRPSNLGVHIAPKRSVAARKTPLASFRKLERPDAWSTEIQMGFWPPVYRVAHGPWRGAATSAFRGWRSE